ncbi:MAG: NAD(P)/FAD-dependent oxidoreductase [Verrucomicrobiota bacterium]
MIRVAIIGAGISALSISHLLGEQAVVTLFEKARAVSGRMSTRRAGPYPFDHGAQYFTVRTEAFQSFIEPFIQSGLIKRWNARHVIIDRDTVIERQYWISDEPRYVGVPGMNNISKKLAEGLNIHLKTKISALQRVNGTWHLLDEQGRIHGDYNWVISTVPSAQAAELLPTSFRYHDRIRRIEMLPCFALMLGFPEKLALDFDAAHVVHADISWIAVNSSKPGRSGPWTLVVHSSADFAKKHLFDDRDAVIELLSDETSRVIGHNLGRAGFKAVHGWHFANNAKRDACSVLLDQDLKLAACGDWSEGGRIEGAFTSAVHLASAIKVSAF